MGQRKSAKHKEPKQKADFSSKPANDKDSAERRTFLDLPAGLRNVIYELALEDQKDISFHAPEKTQKRKKNSKKKQQALGVKVRAILMASK